MPAALRRSRRNQSGRVVRCIWSPVGRNNPVCWAGVNFMSTVTQYKLVVSDKLIAFMDEVQAALNEGWELSGGVSVVQPKKKGTLVYTYNQAMIRRPLKRK